VSKFVGKFRKNKEYNDDYNYTPKRSKNEHAEIKKILAQAEEENDSEQDFEYDDFTDEVVYKEVYHKNS
jgi:hypothetical protein